VLATGVCVLWTGGTAPRAGESILLRWTRTAAAHPVRTCLALTLIAAAIRSQRRS